MQTVKRIGDEEFDLIDDLHGLVRLLALALWQRLATDGIGIAGLRRAFAFASRAWPRKRTTRWR